MAFLWGESMGPEELGKAMLALRCVRGMHLDMNAKHTGLEFYRPFAPGNPPPALGRKLGEMEFEGAVEQSLGFAFRSRLAVKTMSPLRFPRYLQRDPRDYFFLTLKPVLPGPALTIDRQPVAFSTNGLPQAGWPAAFARARLGAADAATHARARGSCASISRARCPRRLPRPSSSGRWPCCKACTRASSRAARSRCTRALARHAALPDGGARPRQGRAHRSARRAARGKFLG